MRGQILLLEAVLVFAVVAFLLILTVPLHVDVSPFVEAVREHDLDQVSRLAGSYSP